MQIRIDDRWVIFVTKNNAGICLADLPESMQSGELNVSKIPASRIKHYATIFGAVQGLFKYLVLSSKATSLLDLEQLINVTASKCQSVFVSEQLSALRDEKVLELQDEVKNLNSRRSDFEAMHPNAKLLNFDSEKLVYFGDGSESINNQWSTWCACLGMLHLEDLGA